MLLSAAEMRSATGLKASLDREQKERELRFKEDQRVRDGQPFLYEPHFYPWCSAATPHDRAILDAVARARDNSDAEAARELSRESVQRGMRLIEEAKAGSREAMDELASGERAHMNPVSGEIMAMYTPCAYLNLAFDCPLFTEKEPRA